MSTSCEKLQSFLVNDLKMEGQVVLHKKYTFQTIENILTDFLTSKIILPYLEISSQKKNLIPRKKKLSIIKIREEKGKEIREQKI